MTSLLVSGPLLVYKYEINRREYIHIARYQLLVSTTDDESVGFWTSIYLFTNI